MIRSSEVSVPERVRHIRKPFREVVEIARSAECPIGIGHTFDDCVLPEMLILMSAAMRANPVQDVIYYRSVVHDSKQSHIWSVLTNRGRVSVIKEKNTVRAVADGLTEIVDFNMTQSRVKLLSILGCDAPSEVSMKDKDVTLIGDFRRMHYFTFAALEFFCHWQGAKMIQFVSLAPR